MEEVLAQQPSRQAERRDNQIEQSAHDKRIDDRVKGEITARPRPVRVPGWGTRHPAATALAAFTLLAATVWAAKAMAAR